MEALKIINTPAIPILASNINTDIIMPSREMRKVERKGLQEGIFADWRYLDESRTPDPNFILNDIRFKNARIILAGKNFGCGSSREFAVWGLYEYGIRAIIAPSFGDIFFKNCVLNGILPAMIEQERLEALSQYCSDASPLIVNLKRKEICYCKEIISFDIDDRARTFLLEGLDQIDRTLNYMNKINDFITADKTLRSWVYEYLIT